MQAKERIFLALDNMSLSDSVECARELAPYVGGFKVGLELISRSGGAQVVSALKDLGCPIFYDCKLHDIPNTVAGAVKALAELEVEFINVHALGGMEMMSAAVEASKVGAKAAGVKPPRILAVTLLTSMGIDDVTAIGLDHLHKEEELHKFVVHLARCAFSAGCDGVVASPKEILSIREACGKDFLIVTPGVRPEWANENDQLRVATPAQALKDGADFLVIGRPVTKPPAQVGSRVAAAKKIIQELHG